VHAEHARIRDLHVGSLMHSNEVAEIVLQRQHHKHDTQGWQTIHTACAPQQQPNDCQGLEWSSPNVVKMLHALVHLDAVCCNQRYHVAGTVTRAVRTLQPEAFPVDRGDEGRAHLDADTACARTCHRW
jgi:hypothetical protein